MSIWLSLALVACVQNSHQRLERLHGPVSIDTAWTELVFQKPAVSTYPMNAVKLVTEVSYGFRADSGITEPNSGRSVGLEVLLESKGGQEYRLTDLATQSSKNKKTIWISGNGLQTQHVGNIWTKIKLRSRMPIKVKEVEWHTYDPTKVEN